MKKVLFPESTGPPRHRRQTRIAIPAMPYHSCCDVVSQFLRCHVAVVAMPYRSCCDATSHALRL
jgi:hypothetical protein